LLALRQVAHPVQSDRLLLGAFSHRRCDSASVYGAAWLRGHHRLRHIAVAVSSDRIEIGIGGTLSVWTPQHSGITIQNGPALLNVKGILFPLLRNPVPDSEFTFGLQLQQQLRIPRFDGLNDLGTETLLTALRAVADKPFW